MKVLLKITILTTICIHLFIAYFEIFAWESIGKKVFHMFPPAIFSDTTQMATNQGVYNLFLVAGLIWSLFIRDIVWKRRILNCFLIFILIAGIVASMTISTKAGLIQIIPSALGLILNNVIKMVNGPSQT